MTFESPEPLAVPLAVAPIPGLEVAGSAALESADATSSSLTLDALKGNGDVTLSGIVHIETVRIEAGKELNLDLRKGTDGADDAIGGSRVTVDAVTGSAGTVRFGLLGTNGTTGEQTVINSLLAGGFTGTVGFLMPDYSTLDFEDTQLPALPFTLEVQPGQTVVMRLDQYADANIVWPEDCSGVKLILVEAGPFGGEASIPAWPEGVTFEFHRYDSNGHAALTPNTDYTFGRNDDGITIDLSWQNPVLDGKVAWVDVEFNGDSYNTGWFRIGSANGMLQGVGGFGTDEILDNNDDFTTTYNPAGEGVNPRRQPYIPVNALPAYPDSWSIVARVTAAEFTHTVMLAIGANYKDVTGGTGDDFSDRDTLVLSTGSMKAHGGGGTAGADDDDDNKEDTIRLWLIRGRDLYGENPAVPTEYLAQASLPQVTEMPHLYTITYDNRHIQVYVDGHCLMDTTLPEDINATTSRSAATWQSSSSPSTTLPATAPWTSSVSTAASSPTRPSTASSVRIRTSTKTRAAPPLITVMSAMSASSTAARTSLGYKRGLGNGNTLAWAAILSGATTARTRSPPRAPSWWSSAAKATPPCV